MKHSYIIVDDNHESILNTQATAMRFQNLAYMGYATNYEAALNLILEHQPSLIFLEINPLKKESNLSLNLINELYRYLTIVPKIIVTSKDQSLVFRAMEYGVADYLMKPLELNAFRKAIFKFDKLVSQNTVSNPVVEQQTVPQQALTFSDFLRQEPIQKPVEKPIVEEVEVKKEEPIDAAEIIVDAAVFETGIIESEANGANESVVEDVIEDKVTDEETNTPEKEEETLEETKDSIENEASEESNDEALEIATSEEETETVNEVLTQEENSTKETIEESETIETETPEEPISQEEVVENTKPVEAETIEDAVSDDETNDDEAITTLPGQKVIVAQEDPLIICVKSYGDYRYIDSRDIIYFEADNNSVDIHLKDGEMVTAFKTLKAFESVLPPTQFLRIHNSYILNVSQVARIHTGNNVCYIKNSTIKLPFSKSYKENVELIIHRIASGNYLEI